MFLRFLIYILQTVLPKDCSNLCSQSWVRTWLVFNISFHTICQGIPGHQTCPSSSQRAPALISLPPSRESSLKNRISPGESPAWQNIPDLRLSMRSKRRDRFVKAKFGAALSDHQYCLVAAHTLTVLVMSLLLPAQWQEKSRRKWQGQEANLNKATPWLSDLGQEN